MNPDLKPLAVRREGDGLLIAWSDGVTAYVDFGKLRKNCPCATCNDLRQKPEDPFKILSAQEISAGKPVPVSMQPRGHYAYQIAWNDGHDTGIYSLQLLRQLGEPKPA